LRNGEPALTAGELNYQIFYYVKHQELKHTSMDLTNKIELCVKQFLGEKPNYQKYNDMTGALVRCVKEIVRRLKIDVKFLLIIMQSYDDEIAKYEDIKILENGDVE
jgi:hypothetical protein